jgi:uncharacterized protein YidB (DUF937 family)
MLSDILNAVKSSTAGELISKAGISQDQIDGVFDTIGDVTKDKVGGQLASGNLDGLMSLFSKGANNGAADGIQSALTSGIATQLADKFGFSEQTVSTISAIVVPKLISMITSKNSETPDDDPSPLTSMFGGNIADKAKDALGGLF